MHISPERTAGIIMMGCFDTKAEVFAYLYQELIRLGRNVITVNTGILGTTDLFPVQYENHEVMALAGHDLAEIAAGQNRNHAIEQITKGARILLENLSAGPGGIAGVIGMGGGGGSYIVLKAMQGVPFGIPKLCISTLASKDVTHLTGIRDIMLVPSIVDVAGLNSIISTLVRQAALAIDGMATEYAVRQDTRKRIAVSMFGNTTRCVDACTALLNEKGYEVFPFHANGSGGKAMEELIRGGYFDAVLDITTTELADDLCGGICSAGPERLTAAGAAGIPQVVVPGCLDMVNFGVPESVPMRYHDRLFYNWSPDVTLMRTNFTENMELGNRLSDKVLQSTGPVSVLFPMNGLSEIDKAGSSFYNERSNKKLLDTIVEKLSGKIPVTVLPLHINDPAFAEALVEKLIGLLEKKRVEVNAAGH